VLAEQAGPSGIKHPPSFESKKVLGIENVKLIWIFHFYHGFALNSLIVLIFYTISPRKRQGLFYLFYDNIS